jgi:choloylglycine hydrolase
MGQLVDKQPNSYSLLNSRCERRERRPRVSGWQHAGAVASQPRRRADQRSPFAWQLSNIGNYVGLTSVDAAPITIGSATYLTPGHGSGMRGLPGDSTPPSRFIRLLFQKQFATQPANSADAGNLALHLLNTVDIPLGTSPAKNEQKPSKGNDDYTQWVVVKALTARTFSYRTADNPTLMQINFDELDLGDAREVPHLMPQEATSIDITDKLMPIAVESR